jgi:hypothetical protein
VTYTQPPGIWGAPIDPRAGFNRDESVSTRSFNEAIITYVIPTNLNEPSFFDNVPIVPSAEQINAAVTVARFRDILNPLNDRCPISLIPFAGNDEVMRIARCGHVFGMIELSTWFQCNARCPVCRCDVRYHLHGAYRDNGETKENYENNEDYGDVTDLGLYTDDDDAREYPNWDGLNRRT